ncbi:hypothetical protein NZD89_05440 [Alicyclobacillus fastidiosus]|uniref:Uncharacterized protein n=1 Tax=Alicyclobacillus fastidiosus TaxID=392011 RepID=A0ABY6ZJ03_9BACL|nr:hypothetical protein [Alicyclobacillus fastidiosus]WAH42872.1 hypothetical protein NZD89_05440 [Alicyclobacillus fastidiosus]
MRRLAKIPPEVSAERAPFKKRHVSKQNRVSPVIEKRMFRLAVKASDAVTTRWAFG